MGWLLALLLSLAGPSPGAAVDRRAPALPAGSRFGGDEAPIAASLYSLPASFVDPRAAASFLAAVRALDGRRTLLALVDPPAKSALAGPAKTLGVRLLDNGGRAYTPWVRDPLSFFWAPKGRLFVLTRPNLQAGREADFDLGRQLVASLPADLDHAWGRVRWAESKVPFHNGQILTARSGMWISLHSLEPRILELLGIDRVPVETFGTAQGLDRYLAAAAQAAAELGALYDRHGRPARFVHPLPEPAAGPLAARIAAMRTIGGGAGADLDSYLTLLPGPGAGRALVADPSAGKALLAAAPAADLEAFRQVYGLAPKAAELKAELEGALATPSAAALAAYLEAVAGHLRAEGFAVSRLPLLIVPVRLLADSAGVGNPEIWITWNNVVVETRNGMARAEGFASLLPTGDRRAGAVFAAAGCHLDLVPPLVKSVILGGGYRCASNHVRSRRGG